MSVFDFLPKYPFITERDQKELNPYRNFYNAIYHKKEFYDQRLDAVEPFPTFKGGLMKHQRTIARFLSSHTPYSGLLVVHEMGTGKTCSAIAAIEQLRREYLEGASAIKGAYIFARGAKLLDNFKNELVSKCTAGQYDPRVGDDEKLTDREVLFRSRKLYREYYNFTFGSNTPNTFAVFAKHLQKLTDDQIRTRYSNHCFVIDEVHNIRIQKSSKKSDGQPAVDVYRQFHRFLHVVQNVKVLLLTGTPMNDAPQEIADILNLILPLDQQLPRGQAFVEEYMEVRKETKSDTGFPSTVYAMRPDKVEDFKKICKGRVSYLKSSPSSVPKTFTGYKKGGLEHFKVDTCTMSEHQRNGYLNAYTRDTKTEVDEKTKGVYIHSRNASAFVFPDGTFGADGYNTHVITQTNRIHKTRTHSFTPNMKKTLKKSSTNEQIISNIGQFSCKYAKVIEEIIKYPTQNCFVFSSLVRGGGAIVFSLCLEMLGYKRAKGKEKKTNKRYALLTGDTNPKEAAKIIQRFNRPDNRNGQYIQVIIGSAAFSEGFSLYNIQREFILSPWFNFTAIDQAIARGHRVGSHRALLKGRNPTDSPIKLQVSLLASLPGVPKVDSIDLQMYKLAEDKDLSIMSILHLLKECSFDCALNYRRNVRDDALDGKRDCEYTDCKYTCDGVDYKDQVNGIPEDALDYSTYQLYYTGVGSEYGNDEYATIRRDIGRYFRVYKQTTLDEMFTFFDGQYTREEIYRAIYSLLASMPADRKNLALTRFEKVYGQSPRDKLATRLRELFRAKFSYSYEELKRALTTDEYLTDFQVLSVLDDLITSNAILMNKYGFNCFLREDNDVYFLVTSLTPEPGALQGYYTAHPTAVDVVSFADRVNTLFYRKDTLNHMTRMMVEAENDDTFLRVVGMLPVFIQEYMIEFAVLAKRVIDSTDEKDRVEQTIQLDGNIKLRINENTRTYINRTLDYFAFYVRRIEDGTTVSSRLERLRCLLQAQNSRWEDCKSGTQEKLNDFREKEITDLEGKAYGLFNPETGAFSIVPRHVAKSTDNRTRRTGQSSATMKLPELVQIAMEEKLPTPGNTKYSDISKEQLMKEVKRNTVASKVVKTAEAKTDDSYLRRLLYWSTKDIGSSHRTKLVIPIKKYFTTNNRIIPDDRAGTTGGHKKSIGKTTSALTVKSVKSLTGTKIRLPGCQVPDDVKNRTATVVKKDKTILGAVVFSTDDDESKDTRIIDWACITERKNDPLTGEDYSRHAKSILREALNNKPAIVTILGHGVEKEISRYNTMGFTTVEKGINEVTMRFV